MTSGLETVLLLSPMIKAKTKYEKEHMAAVADLGCIICGGIAELHHPLRGGGKRVNHMDVIPLCPRHHNRPFTHGVAFHAGKKTWQAKYGTERELLDRVNKLLEY